jgi:hypothetical protein
MMRLPTRPRDRKKAHICLRTRGARLRRDQTMRPGEGLRGLPRRLHEHAQGDEELYVIDDGMHFDFYDRPEYVGPAVTKINEFLTNHQPIAGAGEGRLAWT